MFQKKKINSVIMYLNTELFAYSHSKTTPSVNTEIAIFLKVFRDRPVGPVPEQQFYGFSGSVWIYSIYDPTK